MPEPVIIEQSIQDLGDYNSLPMSFQVRSILELSVIDQGLGGFILTEKEIKTPYIKDYDAFDSERPAHWAHRWDISKWGFFAAFIDGVRVGGCAIAYDTPGLHKLEDRNDIAALWDLRVHPDHRRTGIGSMLFQSTVIWARQRTCRLLKVETQNINVPACRFYAKHGCVLGSINRCAYDEFTDEVELVWHREL